MKLTENNKIVSVFVDIFTNFFTNLQRNDFPVEVNLRQRLHFLARVFNAGDSGIFLKSCRATPTANPLDHIYYEFIRDG